MSPWACCAPGYPTFSTPWSDLTAVPRRVALVVASSSGRATQVCTRDPQVRFLIRPRVAEEVVAASDGRLVIAESTRPEG